MVVYNFKKITVVPTAKDFVDIVLSKTQRKTPTVVHPGYSISRIRSFYMRKVKFTQQTFHDRLSTILDEFPILDDIHPFYADLMNVLYDRDHYKLALGQINNARNLIDNIASDYVKLLKYGDQLYRCKQLKRAALGRMCTLMSKQQASLAYLEQVRQHMARLPTIDPNTRTLILCGFPNVGKSSFLNRVSRAEVDVQPYPFTTKSLFVGHTDYKYLRFQVIDTPGILDHPLEQRNTIEMQSITALAHLRAAVLYVVDISEECGYSLDQQITLFNSIKPLFSGKPLLICCNKIDVMQWDNLPAHKQQQLQELVTGDAELVMMSTMTEDGVSKVKELACERLLSQRVEQKLKHGKKTNDILNRLHLATPKPRDNSERPPTIPKSVARARVTKKGGDEEMKEGKEEEEEEDEEEEQDDMERDYDSDYNSDEDKPEFMKGLNSLEWKRKYKLKNPDHRFDNVPEIVDGHNIADFIDPEILARLEELEREEEEREAELAANPIETYELDEETKKTVTLIKERRKVLVGRSRARNIGEPVPKSKKEGEMIDFAAHLTEMGLDPTTAMARARSRSRSQSRMVRKRSRSQSQADKEDAKVAREHSHSRSVSRSAGFKNIEQKEKTEKLVKLQLRRRGTMAIRGESDRVVLNDKPKHLFAGKRKAGKTDRR